jgi:hypothetical protein
VLVEAPIKNFHIAYLDVVSNDLRKRQQKPLHIIAYV